ncbi:uncharacterized protein L3040_000344 [Drepanopeziza brunnea f. sp. 'multigermtubi']|uniref:25S rRNA (Uridine(2843)-N(3))-methyltransferase n=1 Tax=Marssonina brunnea f. sp. multigermtubi (strain MB_m1) TaxID=1072389 RepID=K1XH99_MARBU|nr:uncharacterized protein MBM_09974 [Drepanopeziza brunnea f. sp. 'multigermtubi' MB_m1]EKD11849.1 hypothetical protein MBM_09974 [Drepanopeziza brunnea f. sp. 'multigermtubi' MB_m1]KAJ5054060.1 hypothetical protein L3040_000344 [Drepanopeziza brunnea f. sp. 'multigermtubi']
MGKGGRSGRIVNDFGPTGNSKKGPSAGQKKAAAGKAKTLLKSTKVDAEVNEEGEGEAPLETVVRVKIQQSTLNIFKDTFPEILLSERLQTTLQEVKAALYNRDFERAFGRKDYLEAYSVRWSPSRALCYQAILVDLQKHFADIFPLCQPRQPEVDVPVDSTLHVVAFGGGAAEVVAFGGFLRCLLDATPLKVMPDADLKLENLSITNATTEKDATPESIATKTVDIDLQLIDSASWQDVCSRLLAGLTTLPTLSKYANALARETNSQFIPDGRLESTSHVENCLEMDQSRLEFLFEAKPLLCTLLFTLNELYTASISKATTFLINVTNSAKPGTLLLVVDSPGSYSETQVGSEAKRYPMKWLMDHTLMDPKQPFWEKIVSDDSRWFRIPNSLRYPIQLENMRCQMHLYRRI